MDLVWKHAKGVQGNDLVILLALADWSNDQGLCWPSISSLARKARVSERTARYALGRLETGNYLTRIEHHGRTHTNEYLLNLQVLEPEKVQQPLQVLEPVKPAISSIKPASNDIKPAIAIAAKPLIEPLINRQEREGASRQPAPVKTPFRKTHIPADFEVTDEMYSWAYSKFPELNVDDATETWRDAMIAKGFQYIDWTAAWRNGMKNAVKWAAERKGKDGDETTKFGRAVVRAGREIASLFVEPIQRNGNGRAPSDYQDANIFRLPEPKTSTGNG
jgi:helix-turn-helix protein